MRSYKLRGRHSLLVQLSDEELAAGVVCSSAGNHAETSRMRVAVWSVHSRVAPAETPKQKREADPLPAGKFIDLIVGGSNL